MRNIFSKAILAAVIGLGTLAAIPATASAEEIVIVRDGWHREWGGRDGYRPRYERYDRYEGRRWGYWDRPWRHHHHHPRCFRDRWGELVCVR